MLLDGIRSMTGQKAGGAHGLSDQANAGGRDGGGSPWGNSGGGGDLARQAGADDVGRSGSGQRQGIADDSGNRNDDPFANAGGEDLDLDAEGFDDGDSGGGDFGGGDE
jgi:hypothetical protein